MPCKRAGTHREGQNVRWHSTPVCRPWSPADFEKHLEGGRVCTFQCFHPRFVVFFFQINTVFHLFFIIIIFTYSYTYFRKGHMPTPPLELKCPGAGPPPSGLASPVVIWTPEAIMWASGCWERHNNCLGRRYGPTVAKVGRGKEKARPSTGQGRLRGRGRDGGAAVEGY